MNTVKLKNLDYVNDKSENMRRLSYPRLQVNKSGEIVLVTSKDGCLSRGVLIGKTPKSKTKLSIGCTISDWEVAGELTDYDGVVDVSLMNKTVKN